MSNLEPSPEASPLQSVAAAHVSSGQIQPSVGRQVQLQVLFIPRLCPRVLAATYFQLEEFWNVVKD